MNHGILSLTCTSKFFFFPHFQDMFVAVTDNSSTVLEWLMVIKKSKNHEESSRRGEKSGEQEVKDRRAWHQ